IGDGGAFATDSGRGVRGGACERSGSREGATTGVATATALLLAKPRSFVRYRHAASAVKASKPNTTPPTARRKRWRRACRSGVSGCSGTSASGATDGTNGAASAWRQNSAKSLGRSKSAAGGRVALMGSLKEGHEQA